MTESGPDLPKTSTRKLKILVGAIAGYVAIADGLAMVVSAGTSALGGAALLLSGFAWFAFGMPRVARPVPARFVPIMLSSLGVLLLPVLFLPVCGLWLVATPSKLSVGFTVAWATCCLVVFMLMPCPICGKQFNHSGGNIRVRPRCANCGGGYRTPNTGDGKEG
jgi:hypothetical protein